MKKHNPFNIWANGDFRESFNVLAERAHKNAKEKGFWGRGKCNSGEKVALMHSELSEALESIRKGDPADDKIPMFKGSEAEFADTIIRIMDYAAKHNLRVGEAVIAKMAFNSTRTKMHGKKF